MHTGSHQLALGCNASWEPYVINIGWYDRMYIEVIAIRGTVQETKWCFYFQFCNLITRDDGDPKLLSPNT